MILYANARFILVLMLIAMPYTNGRTNMYTLPAYVGIILKHGNRVLLIKRCNSDWASERWNFPGGLLEEHETLLQAAIRETKEETGVTVDQKDFTLVHVLHVQAGGSNTRTIIGFYFMAEQWDGTPINNEPDKHSDIGWFDVDNFPATATEHARQALHGLLNNSTYSEN
jgi:8-oxo-dGTP diphosphatase